MKDGYEIVVSLGTDHHQFDRLVHWVDDWLDGQENPPSCIVQHGSSARPRAADAVDLVSRDRMLGLYAAATVIVVQGGPGSIFDVRGVGRVPIAVPRRAEFQEVVDDHQVAFCRQLEREQEIRLAETREGLTRALQTAFLDPGSMVSTPRPSPAPQAAAALRNTVHQVLARPVGVFSVRRALQTFRPERWRRRHE